MNIEFETATQLNTSKTFNRPRVTAAPSAASLCLVFSRVTLSHLLGDIAEGLISHITNSSPFLPYHSLCFQRVR